MKTNPHDYINQNEEIKYMTDESYVSCGLTKREYFAVMAMQGFISRLGNRDEVWQGDVISKNALICADALIEELNRGENEL